MDFGPAAEFRSTGEEAAVQGMDSSAAPSKTEQESRRYLQRAAIMDALAVGTLRERRRMGMGLGLGVVAGAS